jgi:hypothetical protein
MDAIEKTLEHWRSQGIPLNPGASDQDLNRLEAFLGCPLPADVHRFYATADGMRDCAHDSKAVSFWPIDRILLENDFALAGEHVRAAAFADVMFYAWTFRYALRPPTPLWVMTDGSTPISRTKSSRCEPCRRLSSRRGRRAN